MFKQPDHNPTEAEIAWAAGLYEGEGTCVRLTSGRGQWMAIRMTDKEPIQRMYKLFGGTFRDEPFNAPEIAKGWKPKFLWRVNGWSKLIWVSGLLYPWLSPRRQAQIDKVLAFRPEFPRGERACPQVPWPSVLGYTRHRRLGEPACAICLESLRLYNAQTRQRNAKRIAITNREQYAKNREARLAKQHAYNLAHRDEINARQRAYSARKRQMRTSIEDSLASAEMPSALHQFPDSAEAPTS